MRCATCGRPENDHPVRHPFKALKAQSMYDEPARPSACGSSIDCAWICPGCPTQTICEATEGPPLCEQQVDPMGTE